MTDVQEAPAAASANKYPTDTEINACLTKAAGIMRERGLQQYGFYGLPDENGKRAICTAGSIVVAATGEERNGWDHDKLATAAVARFNESIGRHPDGWALCEWNNEPGRTTEQAAEALEKAAAWTPS
jgi:hypothetical protein